MGHTILNINPSQRPARRASVFAQARPALCNYPIRAERARPGRGEGKATLFNPPGPPQLSGWRVGTLRHLQPSLSEIWSPERFRDVPARPLLPNPSPPTLSGTRDAPGDSGVCREGKRGMGTRSPGWDLGWRGLAGQGKPGESLNCAMSPVSPCFYPQNRGKTAAPASLSMGRLSWAHWRHQI